MPTFRCICQISGDNQAHDIQESDYVQCDQCKYFLHTQCVGLEDDVSDYICLFCLDDSQNVRRKRRQVSRDIGSDGVKQSLGQSNDAQNGVKKRRGRKKKSDIAAAVSQSPNVSLAASEIPSSDIQLEVDTIDEGSTERNIECQEVVDEQYITYQDDVTQQQEDLGAKKSQKSEWRYIKRQFNHVNQMIENLSWLNDNLSDGDDTVSEEGDPSIDHLTNCDDIIHSMMAQMNEYQIQSGINGAQDAYQCLRQNFLVLKRLYRDQLCS
ncbi:hypothetical protein MIR68_011451 [Amoeboaphelidium protococcarum]|nr:hypothetical protein MIR68_011451 [Amoeboaphelidium protococcarum]